MMRETPSATAKRHRRFQPRQVGPLTASSHQDLLKSPVYLFQGDARHRGKDKEPRAAHVDPPVFTESVATTRQPTGGGDQGHAPACYPPGTPATHGGRNETISVRRGCQSPKRDAQQVLGKSKNCGCETPQRAAGLKYTSQVASHKE